MLGRFLLVAGLFLFSDIALSAPPIDPTYLSSIDTAACLLTPPTDVHTGLLSNESKLLLPASNNSIDKEWPSAPFTLFVGGDVYLTVGTLGIALPSTVPRKTFFTSLEILYYCINNEGWKADKVDLPFMRRNRNVSIGFHQGLEHSLERWHLLGVISSLWSIMIDCGPREILWANIISEKLPVATFSLTLVL